MRTKPSVTLACYAAVGDDDQTRTVELSFPSHRDSAGLPAGALMSLHALHHYPLISLYRVDPSVKVLVPAGCTLTQDGITGRVIEHGDLLELLGAALVVMRTTCRTLDDSALRVVVQRYARGLRGSARSVLALALRNELAWHLAQGTHPDTPGFHEWRMFLSELEAS